MKTIAEALTQVKPSLSHLEREMLLCYGLGKSRAFLKAHPEYLLTASQLQQFNEYVERAMLGEPIAYIIKHREFWSLDIEVSPHTLIPRPETELIVEWVLRKYANEEPLKIADLGTGSGAIALALAKEKPHWQLIATDISENALKIASKNAHRLGLENISFYQGNWCTALPTNDFDCIVSNPPYIAKKEWHLYEAGLRFEPECALLSGEDGLDAIKMICESVKKYLKPKAYVIVEHGFLQGSAVRKLFQAADFKEIETVQDISGHERITLGRNI